MYTHPFDTQFFNVCDKTYCMNRIYPTTLPFNKRVYIPRRTNDHMEAQFTIARTKLRQILGLYIKRQRQNKTDAQQLGIKPACGLQKLIQRTRNGEVICLPTDKSGRMSIDSLPNYIQAMQPHIANTKVTTVQAHEEREKVLNAHMMMWTIVLGPQKRTAKNFQAWNNDIPALYGLRNDHKGFTDPIAGPPTRPVCGANIASNYRISYFLSMIIRPIIRMSPDVCDSTEDLLSRISDCNKTCDLTGCIAHEEREKFLNSHMMMWTIVLGPQKRTANNFKAWNSDIPALYGLRKDHKVITDSIAGPPTRPVCGANIASNYRISYFLSMIIRPIIRMSPDVCDSTADLLSRINDCNNTCDLAGCMVGSTDVVSLYPSIDVDFFGGEVRGDDQREPGGVP
ncbi:Hypothetical predicted protein [Octopus vulgaris]|uniref:Uncharacterized protein n=1 Tax=Octopus vulgaris TaxID=6645 RepID=A0AA36F5R1_OCTVU|nr:Hypothetical predicted protein [Octopus vulgaris]